MQGAIKLISEQGALLDPKTNQRKIRISAMMEML
jgi:hypothetical protein